MTTIIAVENVTNLTAINSDNILVSSNTPTILQVIDDSNILVRESIVTNVLHTGITGPAGADGPVAGITDATESIPFIGSGTGASKTTTEIEGNVIYESFGVGDEILVTWLVPDDIERNYPQYLVAHMFNTSSEVGTFSSWEINITTHNTDGTHITGTLYFVDAPMPELAFEPTNGSLELAAGVWIIPVSGMVHARIKRIVSSNDPSSDVGVMALFAQYKSDGRVGAQGADGAPGGEDEVAQEKRTDFIDDETLYRGEAVPGSVDAASVWRIRKITISAVDGDVREMWADGTADYIKIWNDRLTYTYT